nr:myelin and lymphocyte protein-like [Salvelinus alpinus]
MSFQRASVQIFGGLVWILLASTHVKTENTTGLFVSVFCFIMTFLWLVIFAARGHKNKGGWAAADFAIHGLAAFFYLTASVALAKVTIDFKDNTDNFKNYQIDIAAVIGSI